VAVSPRVAAAAALRCLTVAARMDAINGPAFRIMRHALSLSFALMLIGNLAAAQPSRLEREPDPLTTRIVFVCHVVDDKTLPIVTRELNKAILGLRETQRFDIVVVTDKGEAAGFAKGGVPVLATVENKKASNAFIGTIKPTKSDNPLPAMATVLTRKSDVVYLLTDARTLHKDVNGANLAAVNKAKSKINTILFEKYTKAIEVILQAIAEQNGGTYRYIRSVDLPPP
jgi:hypothetical protein